MEIIKGKIARPRKIMIYGPPGVGKTTWASEAPNPILIQTEEGADDIGTDRMPLVKSYDEFMEQLRYLFKENNGYQYLVIDSLNWLEKLIHAKICEEHGASHIEDDSVKEFSYQAGYSFALEACDDLIEALTSFQETTGLGIIMIAHSRIQEFQDPTTATYDRYVPALHINKKGIGFNSRMQQWCDEVLFLNEKVYTKVTEDKKGNKTDQTKGIGTGERIVYTERRPAFEAKNRLGLPSEMPYVKDEGWSEYALYLTGEGGEE